MFADTIDQFAAFFKIWMTGLTLCVGAACFWWISITMTAPHAVHPLCAMMPSVPLLTNVTADMRC